jgi:Zn2+/Cd2+-exporting ATPase
MNAGLPTAFRHVSVVICVTVLCVMLYNAGLVTKELNIDKAYTQLLPIDKVDKIEDIIEQKTKNKSVIFVGDGINDAPVLTRADVGIAMGGLGSDAAIEAADVVIMDDKPTKVATAIKIAKQTLTIVKENIAFALGIKVLFLILGAFGFVTMWGAVFADVGVTLIAVLNSLRALKIK